MTACKVFISYSHADEWLKDELISHFSALKRNGFIDVWHDRRIPAGGLLNDEIDSNLATSDLFLFLISPNFLQSDYCFHKEYEEALKRHAKGDAEIVPVIVRACDWDVGGLRKFNALPPDGVPVTKDAVSKADAHQRDKPWLDVINGLKTVISMIKKKLDPPKVKPDYYQRLFEVDFVRHPALAKFDERLILIDPDVYCETLKQQVSTWEGLYSMCSPERAVLITGVDRSGKSVVAKKLHEMHAASDNPAILINGKQIRNKDVKRLILAAIAEQFELSDFPTRKYKIIIDDLDECPLPDQIKEQIVKLICEEFSGCVLVAFSNAPSVLFASDDLPNPIVFLINPIADPKLLSLVQKWLSVGREGTHLLDREFLPTFEKLQLVFEQTGLDKLPSAAVTFLQLLDSLSGSDISFSSFAACYEALISNRLGKAGIQPGAFDEIKNFLSLVAYRAYIDNGAPTISKVAFDQCLAVFESQYLSSPEHLRKTSVEHFLRKGDEEYHFNEEYLWYFQTARYVVNFLKDQDRAKYVAFVQHCTANIFQRKFANIVIFIAYFSNDKFVLESLLQTIDGLFSKATDWVISDDTRDIMIGVISRDQLEIESSSDVSQNRMQLLQEKLADIIVDAERVVARYTLPFLSAKIGDSAPIDEIEPSGLDADSYMKSVNALLRTHSVIGQILNGRSGTFGAQLVLDCITRMVKASGRYVSLNHAIAAVLIYDKDTSLEDVQRAFQTSAKFTLEEKYEKVTRIFAFWSVYISHAGLARYLQQDHSIRALQLLADEHENEGVKTEKGNTPFNFTLVKLVAQLYNTGKIDRKEIEGCIQKFGQHSAMLSILRVVIHMYAYYMPISIEDKQWVSTKLRMPLRKIEVQRMKAVGVSK